LHKAFGEFREKTSEKFGLAAQAIKGSFDLIFVGGDRGKTEELKQTLNNLFPQENANKILERLTILHSLVFSLNSPNALCNAVNRSIMTLTVCCGRSFVGGDRGKTEELKQTLNNLFPQENANKILERLTPLRI
jgi:hypothetical protein